MPVQYQVIIIYVATNKYLLDVPVADITRFEKELFEFLDTKYPEIPGSISVCAAPPTRDTERPAFTAGRKPELNISVSR